MQTPFQMLIIKMWKFGGDTTFLLLFSDSAHQKTWEIGKMIKKACVIECVAKLCENMNKNY